MKSHPPVIIIGMHRSGTTMIARLLSRAGIRMGHKKDGNEESVFFQKINDWLLSIAGASWDQPAAFWKLLTLDSLRIQAVERIQALLASHKSQEYLGWPGLTGMKNMTRMTDRWGWKDPRNTITLPIWMDIFPEAKIISVTRHGVDVAASLVFREKRLIQENGRPGSLFGRLWPVLLPIHRDKFLSSPRCSDMDGAFSLWQEYQDHAMRITSLYPDRVYGIRYEELVNEPVQRLTELFQHTGVDVNGSELEQLAGAIQPDRRFAYRADGGLKQFAESHQSILNEYGYPQAEREA